MKSAFSVHNIFGDHMVLQRGKPIRIAGTAQPGSTVSGALNGTYISTKVPDGADGEWVLEFAPMPAGGPYELRVSCGGNTLVFADVLIGDVWFCSGQSNMEFFVWTGGGFYCLRDGDKVAAAAHDDGLRLFQVHHGLDLDGPCTEFPGRPTWRPATTPAAVSDFSAVAYWFGATLREKLGGKVPVGLVNASWGGTRIEPWIPRQAYEAMGCDEILRQLDALGEVGKARGDDAEKVAKIHYDMMQKELDDWVNDKFLQTDPAATAEALASWANPGIDESAWHKDRRGKMCGSHQPGITWYRFPFDVPEQFAGRDLFFHIDCIDDADEAYLDGRKVGQTLQDVPFSWSIPRNYRLGQLPAGRHVAVIRHFDLFSTGSVSGQVAILAPDGSVVADFSESEWMERVEFHADIVKIGPRPLPPSASSDADPRNNAQTPTILYNAEVHPATFANIAGVIWYQGCSNAGDPKSYRTFQKGFIDGLRKAWRDDSLPFLSTQLSAFREHHPETRSDDNWWVKEEPDTNLGYAPFREMQEEFLDLPGSGVACTIDIGDHSDIHPANKKDVGIRLAHEAMRILYGDAKALPGPRFGAAVSEGAAVRVSFRNVGGGLAVDGGAFGPHLWSVAGEDGRHVWAEAKLLPDNTVLVSAPSVPAPRHVRYAYYACPVYANFRRKDDGLPVFPFNADVR